MYRYKLQFSGITLHNKLDDIPDECVYHPIIKSCEYIGKNYMSDVVRMNYICIEKIIIKSKYFYDRRII